MYLRIVAALSFASLLALGCDKSTPAQADPAPADPAVVTAAASAPAAVTPAAAQPGDAQAKEACGDPANCGAAAAAAGPEAGCERVSAEQLTNPKEETVTRPDGTSATHVGDAFAGVEKVAISQLLADPAAYSGKTVALEGDVSAMCQHERAWFSIAAEDQSGRFVRVMTAPTFLVPAGSVGGSARTEGTVEVIEVAAGHARHLAAEHKLGDPAAITANVQQVVLRAHGAEFF